MEVGRSIPRVDAADKVTGRAKYTDDLCPRPVLEALLLLIISILTIIPVKSRLLCKMLYNVFTISTYQN